MNSEQSYCIFDGCQILSLTKMTLAIFGALGNFIFKSQKLIWPRLFYKYFSHQ